MIGWLIFFVLLLLLSIGVTYLVKIISVNKNILDIPNQRSSHVRPIPRGGGLAFVVLFYASIAYFYINGLMPVCLFLALLGGIPVAAVGYIDDVVQVKASVRALVHSLSALWGIACLGWVHFLMIGSEQIPGAGIFSLFAIGLTVWLTNLFNFMDGIDGLAALQAIFISLAAGGLLLLGGFLGIALVCFTLATLTAGFLLWNWPPAKIFMGDVGSGFLGYVLAILMWSSNNLGQLPIPIWWILSLLFICDATFTLLNRVRQRKKWHSAHREHLYQRFVRSGFSHRQVALGALAINIFICLPLSLLCFKWHTALAGLSYIVMLVFSSWLIWRAGVKRYCIAEDR